MWPGYYLFMLSVLVTTLTADLTDTDSRTRHKRLFPYGPLCPAGCVTCSPVSGCVTCMQELFLWLRREGLRQTGHCVTACPPKHYPLHGQLYKKCYQCGLHCDKCTSATNCVTCSPPFVNHNGLCLPGCPLGLHYESYTRSCVEKVDCAVHEWGGWSECTKNGQTCGYKYGIQTRHRETIQTPSANGLACPDLNAYRTCRIKYRYCSDTENNHSDPVPTSHQHNKLFRKQQQRLYRKQKKREKRRRLKCKNRGRTWRHGFCLKKRKRHKHVLLEPTVNEDILTNQIVSVMYTGDDKTFTNTWVNYEKPS